MTREEAIESLTWIKENLVMSEDYYGKEAIDMAIEALSVEAKTKCIARIEVDTEEVVKRIKEEYGLDNAPTIDAESVVRCKECRYWNSKTDMTYCDRLAWVGTEKDDYCSFAERREP